MHSGPLVRWHSWIIKGTWSLSWVQPWLCFLALWFGARSLTSLSLSGTYLTYEAIKLNFIFYEDWDNMYKMIAQSLAYKSCWEIQLVYSLSEPYTTRLFATVTLRKSLKCGDSPTCYSLLWSWRLLCASPQERVKRSLLNLNLSFWAPRPPLWASPSLGAFLPVLSWAVGSYFLCLLISSTSSPARCYNYLNF